MALIGEAAGMIGAPYRNADRRARWCASRSSLTRLATTGKTR